MQKSFNKLSDLTKKKERKAYFKSEKKVHLQNKIKKLLNLYNCESQSILFGTLTPIYNVSNTNIYFLYHVDISYYEYIDM